MRVEQRIQKQKTQAKATLYVCVFDSVYTKTAVALLLGFLLMQPFSLVYASTENSESQESIDIAIESSPEEQQVVLEEVPLSEEYPEVTEVQPEPTKQQLPVEETESESFVGDTTDTAGIGTTTVQTQDGSDDTDAEVQEQSEQSTTTESVVDEDNEPAIQEEIVPSEELPETEVTTATATSTQEEVTIHNSSEFSFDTTQCAVVGDGAYYCSDARPEVAQDKDGVFAAPDSDGDMEIYMRVAGELAQITHNQIDDSAPYYDAHSNRIVWHAIYDDRYQILSYDTKSGDIIRLTNTTFNNMEPVAYGSITLWQAWIDSNWEIMMSDGTIQKQLTNNTYHDVSPHMRDGFVVWQTQFAEGWQVAVYSDETKKIEYIPSEGGLKVENPRFVLVYDSTNAQGDIQTVGYDFDSKTSFNLGALPQEVPDELPEPDQTGETRALIQNKQTGREAENELQDVVPTTQGTDDDLTLDLSEGTSTAPVQPQEVITDIVVPASTTVALPDTPVVIEDLVIPAFIPETQ